MATIRIQDVTGYDIRRPQAFTIDNITNFVQKIHIVHRSGTIQFDIFSADEQSLLPPKAVGTLPLSESIDVTFDRLRDVSISEPTDHRIASFNGRMDYTTQSLLLTNDSGEVLKIVLFFDSDRTELPLKPKSRE